METTYLKTFIEVVKTGSLSKAADTLGVTQPAVSHRIKFLEDQYDFPLLNRSGQTLIPTYAGRMVFDKAEQMLAIERNLLSELKSMRGKFYISLVCTHSFGHIHLPTIMRKFMMSHNNMADISYMIDTPANIVEAFGDGMYDLAVLDHCDCLDFGGLSTIPLPEEDLILVSAHTLNISTGEIDIDDLLSQKLFVCRKGCCSRTLIEYNLSKMNKQVSDLKRCIVIDDLQMILQLTREGQGMSFLPRDFVQELIDAGLLREHYVEGFQHHRKRTIITYSGCSHLQSLPIKCFIEKIHAHFNETPPSPH